MHDRDESNNNVYDLSKAPSLTPPVPPKNKTTRDKNKEFKRQISKMTAEVMMGVKHDGLAPFVKKYHILRDPSGVHLTLQEHDKQVVSVVTPREIQRQILKYWLETLAAKENPIKIKDYTHKDAVTCYEVWVSLQDHLVDPPAYLLQLSEPGFCYNRLTFDLKLPDDFSLGRDCPLFCELFDRVSNSDALMQWIGSLFDPKSNRQQYVWMFGEGFNGKGSLLYCLSTIFGNSYKAEVVPKTGSQEQYWTFGLIGKRLVAFPEADGAYGVKFPKESIFKSVTGGDRVRVEQKNKDSFSADLSAKFIFMSNKKPGISSQRSDLRRVIYCEAMEVAKGVTDTGEIYKEALMAEAPLFFTQCYVLYKHVCDGKLIRCETAQVDDLAAASETEFEAFIEKYLNLTPGEGIADIFDTDLSLLMDDHRMNRWERPEFKEYLHRRYKIVIKKITSGPFKDKRYYPGIAVKTDKEELLPPTVGGKKRQEAAK